MKISRIVTSRRVLEILRKSGHKHNISSESVDVESSIFNYLVSCTGSSFNLEDDSCAIFDLNTCGVRNILLFSKLNNDIFLVCLECSKIDIENNESVKLVTEFRQDYLNLIINVVRSQITLSKIIRADASYSYDCFSLFAFLYLFCSVPETSPYFLYKLNRVCIRRSTVYKFDREVVEFGVKLDISNFIHSISPILCRGVCQYAYTMGLSLESFRDKVLESWQDFIDFSDVSMKVNSNAYVKFFNNLLEELPFIEVSEFINLKEENKSHSKQRVSLEVLGDAIDISSLQTLYSKVVKIGKFYVCNGVGRQEIYLVSDALHGKAIRVS